MEQSFKGIFGFVFVVVFCLCVDFSKERLSPGQRKWSNLPQKAVVWKHQAEKVNK